MPDEVVLLDAVSVAMIARAARDLEAGVADDAAETALALLPESICAELRRLLPATLSDATCAELLRYAVELDEIAEAAVSLDQHDHEIEHQLRWWGERVRTLEAQLTGHPGDDVDTVRELALFRGRISGAHTMRRHYTSQRMALIESHENADRLCADRLAGL